MHTIGLQLLTIKSRVWVQFKPIYPPGIKCFFTQLKHMRPRQCFDQLTMVSSLSLNSRTTNSGPCTSTWKVFAKMQAMMVIQHGGDSIESETITVVFFKPPAQIGQQISWSNSTKHGVHSWVKSEASAAKRIMCCFPMDHDILQGCINGCNPLTWFVRSSHIYIYQDVCTHIPQWEYMHICAHTQIASQHDRSTRLCTLQYLAQPAVATAQFAFFRGEISDCPSLQSSNLSGSFQFQRSRGFAFS